MFKLILLLVTLPFITVLSQDLFIPDNPYEDAPDFIKARKSFNRERWFYEQRMFPDNFLPKDAYIKAWQQKMDMRATNGFFSESSAWTLIGPTPGFYFSYANISGRITTVKYDPVNPNTVYVGAAFGGIWKTTNSGENWSSMTDFQPSLSSGSISVDPNNPDILIYGTGEATYSTTSYYGRGVLRSIDGGAIWTNHLTGLSALTYCSRIAYKPTNSAFLFAAMGTEGLFKSLDSGKTWTNVMPYRCDDVVFSPDGNNVYIIGSGTGFKRSTDGGTTFINATGISTGTRNHVAICRDNPSIIYTVKYSGTTISVYKSTDAGATFTAMFNSFTGTGQAWYDFYIQVNPFDPNYVYVGLIDIWRSSDGGTTFENITYGYQGGNVHVDQHNMDFNPVNSDELFAVNDGGVWKSTDRGTSFINLNNSLSLTQFYRMTSDPSNANHLAGGTQDNGTQRTTGTLNWAAAFGGDGGEVTFHPLNNLNILGETQNNGVYRSINGGLSFSSSQSGLTGTGAWVGPIIAHPTQPNTFYTARQQLFISTNMGAFWTPVSPQSLGTVRELAISKSSPNVMYATAGSVVYKSTESGSNFVSVSNGTPGKTITGIYVHPDSADVAVISLSGFGAGKVYKTSNGGANWFNISGNLPDSPCNDVLIFYPGYSTERYYAALDIGVFVTNDWGTTWEELAEGLPNTVAMNFDYNQSANKLRIGTHGRGVWEITPPTGIVNTTTEIPAAYTLGQNFPNPFNPVTNLKFSLVISGRTTLAVYNTLGQMIETLVNEELAAGTYTVQFDGSKLSSGVYFYKLTTFGRNGSFTETKKMILSK